MKNFRGFTLIELLCAITIFSIIAIGIYSSFTTGIITWRRTNSFGNIYQDARLSLDLMAKELRNSVRFGDFSFEGSKESISFFTISGKDNPSIYKITYFFQKEGLGQTGSLMRRKETFAESFTEEQRGEKEADEIASSIIDLQFEYAYENEEEENAIKWSDDWADKNIRPRSIRIYLSFKPEKTAPINFTKLVFIPTGKIGQEE